MILAIRKRPIFPDARTKSATLFPTAKLASTIAPVITLEGNSNEKEGMNHRFTPLPIQAGEPD